MANNQSQPAPETLPHTVLRAICMDGERVEVGQVVQLTRQQAQEMRAAGKVAPQAPAQAAADAAPPKARPRTPGRNVAG
jgi:hypothetical protein